ncbi:MAG: nuclear transport factor 2 family protein, partial [Saprospiraceae bacterium]|nr:nuclear transport factor 2 family protein [Pyrinomonadaceae bacterium]
MKYVLALTMLFLSSALIAPAQCTDADKKALEALDASWSKAGLSGDKAALMNIYADDYVGFPGMVGKTSAINSTMTAFEKNKANPSGADKVTYDHYMISCTPLTATVTHRNTVWTPDGTGGKPETFYTRSVHVFEKRGGKWLVVSNAGHGLDDYAVLEYMERDWNEAAMKRNKGWLEQNFASDYTSISSGSAALMNKQQDINDTINGKTVVDWNDLSEMNVRIDGNTAIVTGVNHVKGKDDKGVAFDTKVRYT